MADLKPERPSRRTGRGTPPNGGMRFSRGLFGWFLFGALCVALFILLNNRSGSYVGLNISDVLRQLESDNVKQIILENDQVRGEFKTDVAFPGMPLVKRFRADVPPN